MTHWNTNCIGRVVVTVLTNLCFIPTIRLMLKRQWDWPAFIASLTFVCSFMYHLCDSIDAAIILSVNRWHRLDNIGSLSCFSGMFVYMSDFDAREAHIISFVEICFLLVVQEADPWNPFWTIGPVLLFAIKPFVIHLYRGYLPKFRYDALKLGSQFQLAAFVFFLLGLNENKDPLRLFHGIWHAFGGVASYYLFHSLPNTSSFGKCCEEPLGRIEPFLNVISPRH